LFSSHTVDAQKKTALQQFVGDAARQNFGVIDPKNTQFVLNAVKEANTPTDPNSVFEQFYTKSFMGHLDKTALENPENTITEAGQKIPYKLAQVREFTGKALDYREFAVTQAENWASKAQTQVGVAGPSIV